MVCASSNNREPQDFLADVVRETEAVNVWFDTTTNQGDKGGVLTAQDVRDAMESLQASAVEARRQLVERVHAFWESVPAQMRGTEIVGKMAWIIETGYMLHPADKKALEEEYDAELRRVFNES